MQPKRKILIFGGTEFVGRQLVERLSKDDTSDIYLFNRGKTNAGIFPNVKRIIGDRETNDIQKIVDYKWDYVIDFSSYYPDSLKRTLDNVNKDVKKYIYISTISVYSFNDYDGTHEIGENFKKKSYTPEQLKERSLKFYGEKKMACEDILSNTKWLNSIILRPSIIYGKYDPTDRLYYWIERIRKKEKIILPENGRYSLSLTYCVDLLETILKCLNSQIKTGTFNCVSDEPLKIREFLEKIRDELKSNCKFISVDSHVLKGEKLSAKDFPFWFGTNIKIDNTRLKKHLGAKFVSNEKSIQETIDYYEKHNWQSPKIGMSHEEENKLIEKMNTVPNND